MVTSNKGLFAPAPFRGHTAPPRAAPHSLPLSHPTPRHTEPAPSHPTPPCPLSSRAISPYTAPTRPNSYRPAVSRPTLPSPVSPHAAPARLAPHRHSQSRSGTPHPIPAHTALPRTAPYHCSAPHQPAPSSTPPRPVPLHIAPPCPSPYRPAPSRPTPPRAVHPNSALPHPTPHRPATACPTPPRPTPAHAALPRPAPSHPTPLRLNLVYGTMCTLLSTKSIARGWEPVRDATVTKPNPLTSRLWGSHAAAKNPHPTGTYLIRLPFMGPPMVTHAGRGHNICQESRNTSKLPLTLSRVWHIGVANPRRRVP